MSLKTREASSGERKEQPVSAPPEEFVQLFTRHQRRLYLFILAQVPNPTNAEEILQEANVVIWSKCQKFELGSNFWAWIAQIATFEIMKHRQRYHKDKLRFSDEFVDQVVAEVEKRSDELEERREALVSCLGKLRPRDRELIQQRYAPGNSGKEVAGNIGRPQNSVYQSIGRIRRMLLECIQRRLGAQAGT